MHVCYIYIYILPESEIKKKQTFNPALKDSFQ